MSEIKALEKMKAALESCRHTEEHDPPFDTYWITVDACNAYIKALEAEITERYMELPVDADGVPFKPGDMIDYEGNEFAVIGVSSEFVYIDVGRITNDIRCRCAKNYAHVKPSKLVDLFLGGVQRFVDVEVQGASCNTSIELNVNEDALRVWVQDNADEIRELLGKDKANG